MFPSLKPCKLIRRKPTQVAHKALAVVEPFVRVVLSTTAVFPAAAGPADCWASKPKIIPIVAENLNCIGMMIHNNT